MNWLWGTTTPAPAPKPAPKKPAPEPEPECPPGGNLMLDPKLRHAEVVYSGFLFRSTEGYFGATHEKRWVELVGAQAAGGGRELKLLGSEAVADVAAVRRLGLKGASAWALHDRDGEEVYEFTVQGANEKGGHWAERFYASSPEEREQWCARICISALQANEEATIEDPKAANARWLSVMERGPKVLLRGLDSKKAPEKQDSTLIQGYVMCRYESESMLGSVLGWGAGDWKRRWVSVHPSFLSVRDDRSSIAGVRVLPLRDTAAEWGSIAAHPWSFVLSGAFFPDLTLSYEDKPKYTEWRTAVMRGAHGTTPRAVDAPKTEDVDVLVSQEVADIEQDLEAE
eukprot:Hpha_TRINITY_DN1586_c0_g1::TRINITY_DN1586_c0_g1_i1::g.57295::m.57295